MEFETGPWTSFGNEILDQLDEVINSNLITDESDFSLSGNKYCKTLSITPDNSCTCFG